MILLLWFAMADAVTPPSGRMCGPPPVRSPSLMLVEDGKCQKGYQLKKDEKGKPMYCVNTVHYEPAKCVQGPALPRAKVKSK